MAALFVVHAASAQTPVIHIDDDHIQIGERASDKKFYKIPSTKEIDVDFTGYVFTQWPASEPPPDTIAVVVAKDQQYNVAIEPGRTHYSLSVKTLEPRAGSAPFTGFATGQRIILAIGKYRVDPVKKEEGFQVHWVGLVDVE